MAVHPCVCNSCHLFQCFDLRTIAVASSLDGARSRYYFYELFRYYRLSRSIVLKSQLSYHIHGAFRRVFHRRHSGGMLARRGLFHHPKDHRYGSEFQPAVYRLVVDHVVQKKLRAGVDRCTIEDIRGGDAVNRRVYISGQQQDFCSPSELQDASKVSLVSPCRKITNYFLMIINDNNE